MQYFIRYNLQLPVLICKLPNPSTPPGTAMCDKGTVSVNGLQPCHDCPPNYFQSSIGRSTCEECPENTTTTVYGSTSADDCKDAGNKVFIYITLPSSLVANFFYWQICLLDSCIFSENQDLILNFILLCDF